MWACARAAAASSKGIVSSVQKVFRAVSGTNLIKHDEIVTGRLWVGSSVVSACTA